MNQATLYSEPNFQGSTYEISGTDDALGVCNPVTGLYVHLFSPISFASPSSYFLLAIRVEN
jgi:hypothetical protein